jgi:hypothetical protein
MRLGFATPDEEEERHENHRLLRTIPFLHEVLDEWFARPVVPATGGPCSADLFR